MASGWVCTSDYNIHRFANEEGKNTISLRGYGEFCGAIREWYYWHEGMSLTWHKVPKEVGTDLETIKTWVYTSWRMR